MPRRRPFLAAPFVLMLAVTGASPALAAGGDRRPEPLVGLPCEGCEAAFDGLPGTPPSVLTLRNAATSGDPMTVDGRILDGAGNPRPGILIYVYQTDGTGVYPNARDGRGLGREARRHGQLRGWVRSDAWGRYRLHTVRPGSYPDADIPEHIHMQVIEPGCATYLVDDLLFRDDRKLTPKHERQLALGTGGLGIALPQRTDAGWQVTRDIRLGERVPGYPDCGAGR